MSNIFFVICNSKYFNQLLVAISFQIDLFFLNLINTFWSCICTQNLCVGLTLFIIFWNIFALIAASYCCCTFLLSSYTISFTQFHTISLSNFMVVGQYFMAVVFGILLPILVAIRVPSLVFQWLNSTACHILS